jgi:hypothetical protein
MADGAGRNVAMAIVALRMSLKPLRLRPLEAPLTLSGWNIPFVNQLKDTILDESITWSVHIEIIEAKAFSTFIGMCPLIISELLIANIKLTLHKALIRSIIICVCPATEFAADTHLVKSHLLKKNILRTTGKFPRRTPVRDLCVTFKVPYI